MAENDEGMRPLEFAMHNSVTGLFQGIMMAYWSFFHKCFSLSRIQIKVLTTLQFFCFFSSWFPIIIFQNLMSSFGGEFIFVLELAATS